MTARVVVVGLGPAGGGLLTVETMAAIDAAEHRFLRTASHPAAAGLEGFTTFDAVYEGGDTLEEVYRSIAVELVAAAERRGEILYAVPGSPDVAERTVELLRAEGRIEVDVLPALSFADLAWNRLGIDPLDAGVRIVDGQDFTAATAGCRGPFLVAQCDRRSVLSEVKLSVEEPGEGATVTVLQRLGLPDEQVFDVAWADLDRTFAPDHLTSLYVPTLGTSPASELARFVDLVAVLRVECPWDREQTHQSLTRHLVEETYEVLEAIDGIDPDAGTGYAHLEEELGDLLFQVVFHSTLAAEAGQFTVGDVADGIHDKLRRRHPHVFGDVDATETSQVMANWEQIKKEEKARRSVMEGMPTALPALLLAAKVQRKARSAGMDFSSVEETYAKVLEELDEVRSEPSLDEVGDLLFAVTGVALQLGLDPETALRRASQKFADRFRRVEELAALRQVDLVGASPAVVDGLWNEAKQILSRE